MLWHCMHSGARILVDEKRGRNAARELGLEIRGTLVLFVEAKKKGIIGSVKEGIDKLLEAGYYLDAELVEEALRKADEI